jgi:hypothetical protein
MRQRRLAVLPLEDHPAPPRIAEYVVVHELAHLLQPHHTPEFWQRVERAMPDFERRKIWLAEHGMDVEGIEAVHRPMCAPP